MIRRGKKNRTAGQWIRPLGWSVVALTVAIPFTLDGLKFHYQFAWNRSDSLDGTLYLINVGVEPVCDDFVAVMMNDDASHFPGERLLKIAKGCPGSIVEHRDSIVVVDSEPLGQIKPFSRSGDVLSPGPAGVLPDNTWFVWTPHPDSFDSRYASVGWITRDHLIGRATELF